MATAYDWGLDQAAHPAADAAEEEIDPAAHLSAEQLPEMRRLLADGWTLAPDAPMFAFLPAVWPVDRRTWVPDRSAYVEQWSVVTATTGRVRAQHTVPVSPAARAEAEDDVDALLAEAGITSRPRGRLWLLKPPPGYASVDAVLDEVDRRAAAAVLGGELTAEYVRLTTEVLDSAR